MLFLRKLHPILSKPQSNELQVKWASSRASIILLYPAFSFLTLTCALFLPTWLSSHHRFQNTGFLLPPFEEVSCRITLLCKEGSAEAKPFAAFSHSLIIEFSGFALPNVTRSGVWRKQYWGEGGLKISLEEIGAALLWFLFLLGSAATCKYRDQIYKRFRQKDLEKMNLFSFLFNTN